MTRSILVAVLFVSQKDLSELMLKELSIEIIKKLLFKKLQELFLLVESQDTKMSSFSETTSMLLDQVMKLKLLVFSLTDLNMP